MTTFGISRIGGTTLAPDWPRRWSGGLPPTRGSRRLCRHPNPDEEQPSGSERGGDQSPVRLPAARVPRHTWRLRIVERSYMSWLLRPARKVVFGLLVLSTGCAMRVTGIVRDGSTGNAIGGAVLTANDGRNRLSTTDPQGRYAVKTDWQPSTLMVSAPGFVTTTVGVPGSQRFPVVSIDLQRSLPAAGAPIVKQLDQGSLRPGTSAYADTRAASKLQELQELHDRGLISDDEYRRTRNYILQGL
jgi:hypothetical protein